MRWRAGGNQLNFDLHHAFSLWTWALLFTLALTAFSLNLYSEIFYPLMQKVSKVTPSPFDTRPMADKHQPIEPRVAYAIAAAAPAAKRCGGNGWSRPAAFFIRSNSASTASASSSRATTMAPAASATPCCI